MNIEINGLGIAFVVCLIGGFVTGQWIPLGGVLLLALLAK